MANYRIRYLPSGEGIPKQIDSETVDMDFQSVAIGTDKIAIVQEGTGVTAKLSIPVPLKTPSGSDPDDAATISQLTTAIANLTASSGLARVDDDFRLADGGVTEGKIGSGAVTGTKLHGNLQARFGITGATSIEAYTSTNFIGSTDSFPAAISALDAQTAILSNEFPVEEVQVAGVGGTNEFVATIIDWSSDADLADIIVRVGNDFYTQTTATAPSQDYVKTSSTRIQFASTIPEGTKIVVRRERTFSSILGAFQIKKDGVQVIAKANILNFVGDFTVGDGGGGQANIQVTGGGGGGSQLVLSKHYKNLSGASIPALSVVSFDDDGSIILADANVSDSADIAGITAEEITDGSFGEVYKLGEIPNIIPTTPEGATPGQFVYLSETPGQVSLTPPPGVDDAVIVLGLAELPDFAEPGSDATSLYLNPEYLAGP